MTQLPETASVTSSLSALLRKFSLSFPIRPTLRKRTTTYGSILPGWATAASPPPTGFGRLRLSVDVPKELKQFQIIKFLIQPLLENAVLHGLQPDASLHIRIFMRKTESSIEIIISDDGEGMNPERLREVEQHMNDPDQTPPPTCAKGTFIGLKNICQRLKLFYGAQADMSLVSREHQGTTVTIHIPFDTEGENVCTIY